MMHNNEREVHVDFFFVLGFPFDSLFRSLLAERNAGNEACTKEKRRKCSGTVAIIKKKTLLLQKIQLTMNVVC